MKLNPLLVSDFFALLAVSACISTKLLEALADPENKTSYKNIMLPGGSDKAQSRCAFESLDVST